MGGYKISKSLYLLTRILKVYIEDLTEFSHVISSTISIPHCFLKASVGIIGRIYIPRTGKRGGNLQCLGPAHGSNGNHTLLLTAYNTVVTILY